MENDYIVLFYSFLFLINIKKTREIDEESSNHKK